jgi:hypothetical protein
MPVITGSLSELVQLAHKRAKRHEPLQLCLVTTQSGNDIVLEEAKRRGHLRRVLGIAFHV